MEGSIYSKVNIKQPNNANPEQKYVQLIGSESLSSRHRMEDFKTRSLKGIAANAQQKHIQAIVVRLIKNNDYSLQELYYTSHNKCKKILDALASCSNLHTLYIKTEATCFPSLKERLPKLTNLRNFEFHAPHLLDSELLDILAKNCKKLQFVDLRGCKIVNEPGFFQSFLNHNPSTIIFLPHQFSTNPSSNIAIHVNSADPASFLKLILSSQATDPCATTLSQEGIPYTRVDLVNPKPLNRQDCYLQFGGRTGHWVSQNLFFHLFQMRETIYGMDLRGRYGNTTLVETLIDKYGRHLRELYLDGYAVNRSVFNALSDCPDLQFLGIDTNGDINPLLSHLPKVPRLKISASQLSAEGLKTLALRQQDFQIIELNLDITQQPGKDNLTRVKVQEIFENSVDLSSVNRLKRSSPDNIDNTSPI